MEDKANSIARNTDNGADKAKTTVRAENSDRAETIDKTKTTVRAKSPAARKGPPPLFSKETLLRSERFAYARDALAALLADGASYSAQEAENILKNFYKKAVK